MTVNRELPRISIFPGYRCPHTAYLETPTSTYLVNQSHGLALSGIPPTLRNFRAHIRTLQPFK